MASVRSADTWRESGARAERRAAARPGPAEYVSRIGRPPVPPPPPRMRSTELPPFPEHLARAARSRDDDRRAPMPPRAAAERTGRSSRDGERTGRSPWDGERGRAIDPGASRHGSSHRDAFHHDSSARPRGREELESRRRGPRPPEPRSAAPRSTGRGAAASAPERGSRLRGVAAVLAVFLVTLAGAALDSWIGAGLGIVTLATLTGASAAGALLVRRRDLLTMVVAPPLVFIVVAVLNTALAPSASLNLPTVATLLIRGFPAMAIATAAALVVALVRWAARH
ncbi:hypothetical protein E4P41_16330 [Geodermatophilus sp. DF01-2]|uniref:DUF6542 domain-containing protein n=1 Tax=Geodermatophilus sp. DF01-2 TaxID=2559610 RepID=UPI0010732092|nr:DUF6542 domain-containing protein [Geodermatophilus sp. DF01_2]TFV55986.1 hypothetical protein E4P41_16330 [Geodermatophilus sp. DF01_2]